ncbi:MAG: thioesterase family protein [Gemmatimonadales bacterium]|jgi:acyl-CoA thioester hydrolase
MTPGSVTEIRVRYAETDQMGRAHHGAYVTWFELGRTEMMRQHGVSYAALERRGVLLPVVRLEVDYLAAVAYEELLEVHTRLAEVRSRRVRFAYRVVTAEGRTAAEGATVLVCMGSDGRPRRLPDDVRDALAALVDPAPETNRGEA